MNEAEMRGNALFDSIPEEARKRLGVTTSSHTSGEVLFREDEVPTWAHFPHRGCLVSLVRTTAEGTTVEVGVIGWEGFTTVQSLLLPRPGDAEAMIQISGALSRVPLDALRREMNEDAALRDLLLRYAGAFFGQVSQHATCNRVHSIEQRLAKWLLSCRDRTDRDTMDLTHEFLAHMLGTRRAGATVAIGALAADGLIEQGRGTITLRDREGLEERACECYAVVREMMLVTTKSV